jgi:hypothetical protein
LNSDFEIKDGQSGQSWHDDGLHPLMLRMGQIVIAVLGTGEGHNEAVGVPIVKTLVALIRTMLAIEETRDFPDHSFERLETFIDLRWGDFRVKLKHSKVSDHKMKVGLFFERLRHQNTEMIIACIFTIHPWPPSMQ